MRVCFFPQSQTFCGKIFVGGKNEIIFFIQIPGTCFLLTIKTLK
jgi:hypothetical protein